MKKQIKITEEVITELNGTKIAKYLLSIGVYKEPKQEVEENGETSRGNLLH